MNKLVMYSAVPARNDHQSSYPVPVKTVFNKKCCFVIVCHKNFSLNNLTERFIDMSYKKFLFR